MSISQKDRSVSFYVLESSTKYADSEYIEEVDGIFEILEGSVDRFYDNMEKKKKQQPVAEWTD